MTQRLTILEIRFTGAQDEALFERLRKVIRSAERNKGRWSASYYHEGDCSCKHVGARRKLVRDVDCPTHGLK